MVWTDNVILCVYVFVCLCVCMCVYMCVFKAVCLKDLSDNLYCVQHNNPMIIISESLS